MERVFLDTSYWLALLNRRDYLHGKAVALSRRFASSPIVTGEMVLVEVLNSLSDPEFFLRQNAVVLVESLRITPEVTIVPQTPSLFNRAFQRYQTMSDKGWSLTDCASFIIMEDERLTMALTHDHHFVQQAFKPCCARSLGDSGQPAHKKRNLRKKPEVTGHKTRLRSTSNVANLRCPRQVN